MSGQISTKIGKTIVVILAGIIVSGVFLYATVKSQAASEESVVTIGIARIIIDAIRKASTEQGEFVENMREHMLATHEFRGVSGNISIKPDGTSRGIDWSLYTFTEDRVVKNNGRN